MAGGILSMSMPAASRDFGSDASHSRTGSWNESAG
jgi:hypothetical protein